MLAGGKSSRMGKDKGLIPFKGKSMILHSIDALKPVCSSIIIIANGHQYDHLGFPVYQDIIKNSGPLAGLYTGLTQSETNLNIFSTCDSPFTTTSFFSWLISQIEDCDAVVPSFKGRTYPLSALYSKSCLDVFSRNLILGKLKVKDSLNSIHLKKVELKAELPFFNDRILANINTQKELESYES